MQPTASTDCCSPTDIPRRLPRNAYIAAVGFQEPHALEGRI